MATVKRLKLADVEYARKQAAFRLRLMRTKLGRRDTSHAWATYKGLSKIFNSF